MPRGDRTGPMGAGPRTGRAMGYCAGYPAPGYAQPGPGRGLGMGFRGGGRGWRNMFWATGLPGWMRGGYSYAPPAPAASEEVSALKAHAQELGAQLEAIQRRLSELESDDAAG